MIEHDGEDLRNRPLLDRNVALTRLLSDAESGILLNEHIAEEGPTVFAHVCRLGAQGIVSKKVESIRPVLGLDQGPQSGNHCGAARAQRDLQQVILGEVSVKTEFGRKVALTTDNPSE